MLNNVMKMHEILRENIDLPNDGKGNYVVWDPMRRTEVVVPEKVVVKMMADRRIVGGAFNIGKPTDYPVNRSVIYKPSKMVDPNTPKVTAKPQPGGFISSIKQGFKSADDAANDIRYSKFGRAVDKVNQYVNKGLRKSTMR